MTSRLAIFLDDYLCCALWSDKESKDQQTKPAEAAEPGQQGGATESTELTKPTMPDLVLSSQILLEPISDITGGNAIICTAHSDPVEIQQRLETELRVSFHLIGLDEALATTAGNVLEQYLAALVAACLKQAAELDRDGGAPPSPKTFEKDASQETPAQSETPAQEKKPPRRTAASPRFDEIVLAVPLRHSKGQPKSDREKLQTALTTLVPLFGIKKWTLVDAHRLAWSARPEDEQAGGYSAVVGLWRNGISTLFDSAKDCVNETEQAHWTKFPLVSRKEVREEGPADDSLQTLIARSLSKQTHALALRFKDGWHLLPPQISFDSKTLYHQSYADELAVRLDKAIGGPKGELSRRVCGQNNSYSIHSYALIGSLALETSIRAAFEGKPMAEPHEATGLNKALRNERKYTESLYRNEPLNSVAVVLRHAMHGPWDHGTQNTQNQGESALSTEAGSAISTASVEAGPGKPAEPEKTISAALAAVDPNKPLFIHGEAAIRIDRLNHQEVKTEIAGIVPILIRAEETSFPIVLTPATAGIATLQLHATPPDLDYEAMVEYKHHEDGAILLLARLNHRILPLGVTPESKAKGARLELQADGGYRLTLNDEHRDRCKLSRNLRRLVSGGLYLFESSSHRAD